MCASARTVRRRMTTYNYGAYSDEAELFRAMFAGDGSLLTRLVSVFRANPWTLLALVSALQSLGAMYVVSMVNDAARSVRCVVVVGALYAASDGFQIGFAFRRRGHTDKGGGSERRHLSPPLSGLTKTSSSESSDDVVETRVSRRRARGRRPRTAGPGIMRDAARRQFIHPTLAVATAARAVRQGRRRRGHADGRRRRRAAVAGAGHGVGCLSLAAQGRQLIQNLLETAAPGVGALDAPAAFVVLSAWRAGARLTNSVAQSCDVTASSP